MNCRIVFSLFSFLIQVTDVLNCDLNICLTWDVTKDELNLKCQVKHINHAVVFKNPSKKEVGYCLHPIPRTTCFTWTTNNTLKQNLKQCLTVLKIKGHIDNKLNGRWTCVHGTQIDEATINVTVFKEESSEKSKEKTCWMPLGFITSFVTVLVILRSIHVFLVYNRARRFLKRVHGLQQKCLKHCCPENDSNKINKREAFQSIVLVAVVIIVILVSVLMQMSETLCNGYILFIVHVIGVILGTVCYTLLVFKDENAKRQQDNLVEGGENRPDNSEENAESNHSSQEQIDVGQQNNQENTESQQNNEQEPIVSQQDDLQERIQLIQCNNEQCNN